MTINRFRLTFYLLALCSCLPAWGQDVLREGLTLIASKQGAVTFTATDGKALAAADTEVNDAIPLGTLIKTGANGKVVLLFSNGTVATLMPDGQLSVTNFGQEPFKAAAAEKMADLKGEPSKSELDLELEFGDLVVGTKKLNKDSSMDVTTPTGTAGIRGTQFQVAQQPGGGAMALDVTESTVAFTPKGAAAPTLVNANQGLDVAAGGALTARPVNPVAAQQVNNTNTGAVALTAEVSVAEVSAKVDESPPAKPKGEQPKEGQPKEEQPRDEGGDGKGPDGEGKGPDGDGKGPDGEGPKPRGEGNDGGPGASRDNQSDSGSGGRKPPAERAAATNSRPKVNTEQALENNPDAKKVRKLGKIDKRTERLLKKELTDEQMERFYSYPEHLQDQVLNEKPKVVQRLLNLKPDRESLQVFYEYGPSVRSGLLDINDDTAVRNFLDQKYDGQVAEALLTPANVNRLNQGSSAEPDALTQVSDAELYPSLLLDDLHTNGNDFILTELLETSGGELTYQSLIEGQTGNRLLTDVSMASGLDSSRKFSDDEMQNPFYVDATSVWTLTQSDLGLGDAQYVAFAGREVSLYSGSYDYGPYLEEGIDTVMISSSSELTALGSIHFDTASDESETRVVLMSGGGLTSDPGTTISHALSDLVVSVRDDVNLLDTTLSAGRRLELLGQSDVTITSGRMEASESVRLQAAKDLHLNSVQFSQGLPSIYLQANTVNLTNIDFPGGSNVNINSLKGALNGKYPNFGTSSYGRVNFLENVKYGGNLIMDRPGFDQHGQNITIGKIPQP